MRELSLNILDIVTNSIEAEASRIILYINESASKNTLSITIRDNGRGMTKEVKEQVIDPFVTSRTTRSVGMGIPLLKQLAMQCGGDIQLDSELGKGTEISATFQLNNLNRAPLGNMAETMVNLVLGTLEVHFGYIHKTDIGTFWFDSYWMLAQMAERDSSIYEIVEPAKMFIYNGLKRIHSNA